MHIKYIPTYTNRTILNQYYSKISRELWTIYEIITDFYVSVEIYRAPKIL